MAAGGCGLAGDALAGDGALARFAGDSRSSGPPFPEITFRENALVLAVSSRRPDAG